MEFFQAVSTWNVGFEFDQDVVFQAWTGDIVEHTKSVPNPKVKVILTFHYPANGTL